MSINNKTFIIKGLIGVALLLGIRSSAVAQLNPPATGADPWQPSELLAPEALAKTISTAPDEVQPLILSVGPGALIKGSIDIGPASEPDNLEKLKEVLGSQNRDQEIVIYCGCCPFAHCPNIRPAFKLLKDMHFTKAKLLNLSHNIRTDWLDQGYPAQNE